MELFRKKTVEMIEDETRDGQPHSLKKALNWFDLILLGIGGIIGTGIFVITGVAAAKYAGPALIISFVIAGLASAFTALSYAEFASSFPISGSTYSYSYLALGEIVAWVIGWDLILEYAFALPAIALGWSGYFTALLHSLGITVPAQIANSSFAAAGGVVNVPAMGIILFLTWLVYLGIRESATFNNIAVIFKVSVILFFIAVAVWHIKPVNWHPFMPYGWHGVMAGAAIIFFAYIGFDAVSTAAEESKNPARDMPIGIIGSLAVSSILYIAVVVILTGIIPYKLLNDPAPVAKGLEYLGMSFGSGLVSIGALVGITTVLLVMLYGQVRIFFAMSRDGLLPAFFSKLHPKHKTPYLSTWFVGIITSILAGFLPIDVLAELVNIGTLFAFLLVSLSVIILRYTRPELNRKFKCPWVPFIPIMAILFSGYLMISLPIETWIRFIVWFIIGFIIYFTYSRYNSRLAKLQQ
ncbi:MAG: amino acid permease [Desulfurella sp.]|uniref:amino acid permease n=1 Tax=Desulfurella sp. TaxID=1962857 RepID=UPI003D0CAAE9